MAPPTIVILSPSRALLATSRCSRTPLRHASTSTSTATLNQIPPESPKFIYIPQPPQRDAISKPKIKGVLPIPRKIFPKGSQKATPGYLTAVTPEPTSTKDYSKVPPEVKDFMDWKARQSATRRQNLREGLTELHHRKQKTDRRMTAQSRWKQAEHERKIHEPERDDVQFTNPSVLQFMKQQRGILPDPNRDTRLESMKANVTTLDQKRKEERRNALHTLYMNAREFIVTEADLNAKVDEVFDDPWFKNNEGYSIWDKEKFPDGVQARLRQVNKSATSSAMDHNEGYVGITKERVQRIAEELTGGKM